MKILILGGTGLISTSITRQLLERGDDVTLYTRGKSDIRFSGEVKFLHGDRTDHSAFEKQMAEAGHFDCVIDMIGFQKADAESDLRAFAGRTGQLIFCSTVDVYARPRLTYPIQEHALRDSASGYGNNKIICEDLLLSAQERTGLPVTIIRPAQSYGEGGVLVHSMGWTTAYLDRLRKGKPVIVHGDGQSLWVACHIDDVARAFVGAAGNSKAFGKSYNVTGEESLTWNLYTEITAQALGAPAPTLVHIPTDLLGRLAGDQVGITVTNFQFSSLYDNSAAKSDLGFVYSIPFLEGARRTIAWLVANNRIANSDDDPLDDKIIAAWNRHSALMVDEVVGSGK